MRCGAVRAARPSRWRAGGVAVGLALAVAAAGQPAGPETAALETAALETAVLETAAALRDSALAGTGAWDLLRSLTVEASPRFAGTPGDAAGVAWGVATLERLGFERVRAEPVAVPRWLRGEEEGWILDPFERRVVLTALGGSVGTAEPGLTAEVVAVEDLDELAALDDAAVAGRLVFFTRRMERTRDGTGYGRTVRARSRGPSAAAAKGAAGMLLRSVGTSTARVAHTGATRYDPELPKIPAAALSHADADLLEALLERGRPVRFRLRLTARSFADAESANVVGEVVGRERPEEVVLLACHLDSWDLGHGVVDDGAGCAIVIEAARRIAALSERPRRTVRVVLYANEEFGLSGARRYLEQHRDALARHVIGTESDLGAGRVWSFSTRVDPALVPAFDGIAGVLAELGIERGGNEAGGGADLGPLRRAGMPVVSLRQDATRYFDVHHTADDTLAQVVPADLDQNVAAYAAFAWWAAEAGVDFGRIPTEP